MDNFIEILSQNDENEIKKYLSMYGKKKPVSPVFFFQENLVKKGGNKDERTNKHE